MSEEIPSIFGKIKEVVYLLFSDKMVLFYAFFILATIVGLAYHPFNYTFLLTFPVVKIKTLRTVLRAIYVPRNRVFVTLFFVLISIYGFTIVYYNLYYKFYEEDGCYDLV